MIRYHPIPWVDIYVWNSVCYPPTWKAFWILQGVLVFHLCESLATLRITKWRCWGKAKLQSFQTIKVSSFISLQDSVTTSLIILIVNTEADVSVVKMSLSMDLIFVTGETRNGLEMLEGGSDWETKKGHYSTACSSVALHWSWSDLIYIC